MSYMKQLSLATPLVLVTIGLPGAGKSFFARQFSETFGAPVVSGDRLRHTLGANSDKHVEELSTSQAEELLKTQKTFIVDGLANTRAERAGLRKLAKSKGYDVLLIWVQTDSSTSQYRSMKRSAKREDDKYNTSLTADEFNKASRRFSPPIASEACVVISGKHTYATQARIVLKKLVAPRETEVKTRVIVGHEGRPPAVETDRNDNAPRARRNVLIR